METVFDIDKFYKLFINQGFKYSTDSRNIERGCLFFALKGDNFNGNEYAIQAIRSGASYAVIDEAVGKDIKLIKVDNVLRFFQDVANMHRRAFSIPVIAVAGSNGKTTSKNLIKAVLETTFKTHVTAGNFNNHIGVPKTLLDMPQDTEIAVIELGTNNPGEIRQLCQIVEPTHGLITNIGKEHLEGFGSLEAVAKEESELYHHLHLNNGTAFINADDDWLIRMGRSLEHQIQYGQADVDIEHLVPTIAFKYKGHSVQSPLMGDYNLENILTAISIGETFGVSTDNIVNAIRDYTPDNNRSQMIESGSNMIWLDAYNANPSSMIKAIDNFKQLNKTKKVLILGDMFEMGEQSITEHNNVLQHAITCGFDAIYLLGDDFSKVAANVGLTAYSDMESLQEALTASHYADTAFLIKGSRGMKMERALESIVKN